MKSLALSTALLALFAYPVMASNCGPRDQVASALSERYHEEVIAEGYNQRGELMQWWGNTKTGSWSVTASNGPTMCILSAGRKFKRLTLAPNI